MSQTTSTPSPLMRSRSRRLAKNHPEWFYQKPGGGFGNRIGDWWDVIDLDYSQPGLWDYQIETLKYWASMVDGFRCDVAPLVPLEFWLRAREEEPGRWVHSASCPAYSRVMPFWK